MGGHGVPYKIPSPDIYKVEDVPELKWVQEELAKKGLKDPWLRNEVWRYTALSGTPFSRTFEGLTRGFKYAIPAFLITIAIEQAFGITYGNDGGHDDHGDHGDHH
ncbi:NADH dehydrogenase [ubiquinone] 1 beta subcomplex subunit 3 [Habropoda laboriosa]|uniref:NADH dehydrogenase [ubiquinone] 1 beta subcomplex subunit 3 n=1 Tax=Habropoda laboriosa TaxID=597456 RepID=A0A0L7R3E5_9HYME|nr:PREDICTED: NADH dehydrogenase [ubiquinone] 1 beta subcomplex subunit 3 [Habropoda laboriosa]XP_017790068.1 PREDICTED: NADH dehydrogenase [ubiquinone] 1 beta subcomplex subunit 3 [Habropoda laboriosa]XP_017790069.1 PREDICTED: NADH dehydrogenase [ubiquinone] 1 beta subcomplex subunit 3 [Habropoda laboriosa]XP_017790070.1 PREDICTED: NADH dehydrogenase [ubiquinone] 1 beta subcomplex subunit 3 [Habropoda laboriosa]KOC65397.1 NADH dehydrogenase [ubiquinone] 1 beta subcomplex subunit 3 [Habropoda l